MKEEGKERSDEAREGREVLSSTKAHVLPSLANGNLRTW